METRSGYHQSLNELQSRLLSLGVDVENQILRAVDSLKRVDLDMARDVVAKDDLIDDRTLEIEERCLRLIALQQPMASDLRIIGMVLKIAIDLERIADHAVDIAKSTIRLSGETLVKPLIDIPTMAEIAIEMLRDSLLSYTEKDIHRAASLAEKDDRVDAIYSQLLTDMTSMMGDDLAANRQLTLLIMVAHYLERVADHTTNIGEGVIYLVTGKRKDLNI